MKNNGLTRDEAIRLEAYLLSEKAGHPTGMEQFFWMQAEALVQKRSTTAMPARKAATARKAAPKSRAKTKPVAEPALPAAPPSKKKSTKRAVAAVAAAEPEPKPVAAKRTAPAKKSRALPVGK